MQAAAGEDLAEMTALTAAKATAESQNLQRLDATLTMLSHHKEHALEHNECVTCARPFADKTELQGFIQKQVC